jgi:hypothetical protein
MLLRLTPDGNPVAGGWNAATPTALVSQKMNLMVAPTGVELHPIPLEMLDAGLSSVEATVKLVSLCSK